MREPGSPGNLSDVLSEIVGPLASQLGLTPSAPVKELSVRAMEEIIALGESIDRYLGDQDALSWEAISAAWTQGPTPWLLGAGTAAIALTLAQSVRLMRESEKDARTLGWQTTTWTSLPD